MGTETPFDIFSLSRTVWKFSLIVVVESKPVIEMGAQSRIHTMNG